MIYYKCYLSFKIILFPLLVLQMLFSSIGVGCFLATINIRYRDVGMALPFFINLGLFVTPIIYPSNQILPGKYIWLLYLNPMTGIIEGFRSIFLKSSDFIFLNFVISSFVSLFLLFFGIYYFKKKEKEFVDII